MLNYYNYYNSVFCLGVEPALCAHKGTATYNNMQTHKHTHSLQRRDKLLGRLTTRRIYVRITAAPLPATVKVVAASWIAIRGV